MVAPIQRRYRRDQQPGWPGSLARPVEPHAYDTGQIYVAPGSTAPEPGMAVIYDATRNMYRLPATAAEVKAVVGLISYDSGTVQTGGQTVAGNANSDFAVQYGDGAIVKVGVLGTFYSVAYAAMEYGDRVRWRIADLQWEAYATGVAFGAPIDRTAHTFRDADVSDMLDPPGTLSAPTNDLAAAQGSDDGRDIWNSALVALIDQVNVLQATLDAWQSYPAVCVSPSPVEAGALAEIRIGYGRTF